MRRMLRTTIEQILPPQYFTRNLVGAKVDQLVMAELLSLKLPRVRVGPLGARRSIDALFVC